MIKRATRKSSGAQPARPSGGKDLPGNDYAYDRRLAAEVWARRTAPPEPGTPEANPASTLIEPKLKGHDGRPLPAHLQPARWATLAPDGRRTARPGAVGVTVPLPVRTRVVRRTVGEADRVAGGTVRGSEWNLGWRWWVQALAAWVLLLAGWCLIVFGAGLAEALYSVMF